VDSGSLNPKLNAGSIGPEVEKVCAESGLRDRIKAVISHEDLESQGIPHDEVVQLAPETELPIGENARKILRAMAKGVKGERWKSSSQCTSFRSSGGEQKDTERSYPARASVTLPAASIARINQHRQSVWPVKGS
jgi:hypothetical protein